MDLADRLCRDPQATDLYYRFCKRRCEILIDRRWDDVKAIAQALLEHRTLSHAQVEKIIADKYDLALVKARAKRKAT